MCSLARQRPVGGCSLPSQTTTNGNPLQITQASYDFHDFSERERFLTPTTNLNQGTPFANT